MGGTGAEPVWLEAARKVGNRIDDSSSTLQVPFARYGPAATMPTRIAETHKCALAASQGLVPRPGGPENGLRCHSINGWRSACKFRGSAIGMVGTAGAGKRGSAKGGCRKHFGSLTNKWGLKEVAAMPQSVLNDLAENFFAKPVGSSSGRGCRRESSSG